MKFTTHLELQSQTTRLVESTSYVAYAESKTGFSPSMIPCSKGVIPRTHTDVTSLDYNSKSQLGLPDFKFELFPLHSPLLGESLLVSFPPLINMLKFSGYSYFIRDLIAIEQPQHYVSITLGLNWFSGEVAFLSLRRVSISLFS
jgi:hypothetical protein